MSWYTRYFGADYWAYATAEYTAERTAAEVAYLASIVRAEAPGRRVLDVGCGIGRHAVGLAGHGFAVVGVDVSRWALDRAAATASRAGVDVGWHALDALLAGVDDWPVAEVDAVVCVQAFGWGTDAAQLRLLRVLRRLLVPGGVLVLDHSNVSAILRMYAPRSVASVDGHDFEFLRRYDPLTGRSGGVLRVRRPSGETVELPDDVRLYQPPEVAAMLTAAGFEVLRADADFTAGAPITMDTRYVQFVARAPGWPVSALVGHAGPARWMDHSPGSIGAMVHPPDGAPVDLRWAPDEVQFTGGAVEAAWESVAASADPRETARRYDVADPYGAERCAAALSDYLGVELRPAWVTAGAGATGLLRSLALLASGGTVLMDPAGHPELALAARELGAAVRAIPLVDPQAAMDAVRAVRPAVVVLDRPGVTGVVWPAAAVRALALMAAETGGVLVVDETCASYLPPPESAVAPGAAGMVVVRSMSKGYCCGGLRVGFAVSSADQADRVRAVCAPLAAGALALDVAVALLRQGDVLAGLRARIAEVKPRFDELLTATGLAVHPGDPRLPWVTVTPSTPDPTTVFGAPPGIAGKPVPVAPGGPALVRLSVPLSQDRWHTACAVLGGRC